jgi:glycosyltransferase involved in cell wall biosynthesis
VKHILIITYYWPPSGGAGVQRWLKFTKYLPEYGIEPVILTVDPALASYPQKDESLKSEVSDSCKVYTTRTFELYNLYKLLLRKKEIPHSGFANETKPGLLQKCTRFLRSHLLIPDPRKGWNSFAYLKALELIKKYNIETVVTTSPPHSTQLIGLKLKKKLNIRWIADLRDPWTDIYYYESLYHSRLSRSIDRNLEKNVLIHADHVITVSQALKEIFSSKMPAVMTGKIQVIPNGFDTTDFDYSLVPTTYIFTITYTGTITGSYPLDSFLYAMQKLSENNLSVRVQFIGKASTEIIAQVNGSALKDAFRFIDYVPHGESVDYLMKSHALLLVIPQVAENKGILTGKLFEYIGSGRPIIGIGPSDGDAAAIIEECKCGKMFGYQEKEALYDFLLGLIKGNHDFSRNAESMKYSRKSLTNKITGILELL